MVRFETITPGRRVKIDVNGPCTIQLQLAEQANGALRLLIEVTEGDRLAASYDSCLEVVNRQTADAGDELTRELTQLRTEVGICPISPEANAALRLWAADRIRQRRQRQEEPCATSER